MLSHRKRTNGFERRISQLQGLTFWMVGWLAFNALLPRSPQTHTPPPTHFATTMTFGSESHHIITSSFQQIVQNIKVNHTWGDWYNYDIQKKERHHQNSLEHCSTDLSSARWQSWQLLFFWWQLTVCSAISDHRCGFSALINLIHLVSCRLATVLKRCTVTSTHSNHSFMAKSNQFVLISEF